MAAAVTSTVFPNLPPVSDMPTADDVLRVVRTMNRLRHADDDLLAEELVRSGLQPLDAELALVFVPLAFGRAAFERSGRVPTLAAQYHVRTTRGTTISRPLATEPWYAAAAAFARSMAGLAPSDPGSPNLPTEEEFRTAAGRSPEVAAARDLLKGGGTPADLVLIETLLMRVSAEELAPVRPAAEKTKPRSWWARWRLP